VFFLNPAVDQHPYCGRALRQVIPAVEKAGMVGVAEIARFYLKNQDKTQFIQYGV
jgi:hypothetical protein